MPSDPIEAMIAALSPLARRELEASLQADLTQLSTAAQRRVAELGALAEMLNPLPPESGWKYSMIPQAEYDQRRPLSAPSGKELAERYGGWKRACRAAYGLKPDGRRLGPGHAWPHEPGRGHPRIAEYTDEEVIWAVRRCGLELACRPTSTTYIRWYQVKRQLARERGMTIRIPNFYAVSRHFPGGARQRWQRAVTAAALTDEELCAAYAKRMRIDEIELTAADELDDTPINALRQAGLTETSLELMHQGDLGALPLSQAVVVSRALGCSLSYLMRATRERGRPPDEDIRFDHVGYMRRRKEAGLEAERVRGVLDLSPRDARRLALGTLELTVGQVGLLEQTLRLPPNTLFAAEGQNEPVAHGRSRAFGAATVSSGRPRATP